MKIQANYSCYCFEDGQDTSELEEFLRLNWPNKHEWVRPTVLVLHPEVILLDILYLLNDCNAKIDDIKDYIFDIPEWLVERLKTIASQTNDAQTKGDLNNLVDELE